MYNKKGGDFVKLCFNHLLLAFSYALDCVEKDYFKTTSYHGKRVSYMCLLLGEYFQLNNQQLSDLVGCSILHDNGLTEYYKQGDNIEEDEFLKIHCEVGEENLSYIPFFENIQHVILYHHEAIDGSGPFHKTVDEIPLYSQLIHIADWVDVHYDLQKISQEDYQDILMNIQQLKNKEFSSQVVDAYLATMTYERITINNAQLEKYLRENVHNIYQDFTDSQMLAICQLFARIIDSKSPHTRSHSIGVASKASYMALYYEYSEEMMLKLFFAGAMHDVGKLVIDRDVLEKPAQLTDQEYTYMQTHAYYSYKILSDMELGDITHWASFHHEKLDGTGYPFGKKAEDLDFIDRLMACCDIYQALTENRPYKDAMSHEKSIEIMRHMAMQNKIDSQIVEDMNKVFGKTS